MKYRIKKITTESDKVYYIVERCTWSIFGIWLSWKYVDDLGNEFYYVQPEFLSKKIALQAIDENYTKYKKDKVKSIEIEYITKD